MSAQKPLEKILVEPAETDGRVILWERHPQHPDGEIYLTADEGAEPVEVARTEGVNEAIREGRLNHIRTTQRPRKAERDDSTRVPKDGIAVVATTSGATAEETADETTQPVTGVSGTPTVKPHGAGIQGKA